MKHFTLLSLIAAALLFTACEEKTTTEKVEDAVSEIVTPKTDSEKAMDSLKEAAGYAKKAATEAASEAKKSVTESVTHASEVAKEESQKALDATAKKAEEMQVAAAATRDEMVEAVKEKAAAVSETETLKTPVE